MIVLAMVAQDGEVAALVGDREQLGPSAASNRAANNGAGISSLERLWHYFGADDRVCTLHYEQLRSHPSLALKFCSCQCYEGLLVCALDRLTVADDHPCVRLANLPIAGPPVARDAPEDDSDDDPEPAEAEGGVPMDWYLRQLPSDFPLAGEAPRGAAPSSPAGSSRARRGQRGFLGPDGAPEGDRRRFALVRVDVPEYKLGALRCSCARPLLHRARALHG